jgi:hypothetical protein
MSRPARIFFSARLRPETEYFDLQHKVFQGAIFAFPGAVVEQPQLREAVFARGVPGFRNRRSLKSDFGDVRERNGVTAGF